MIYNSKTKRCYGAFESMERARIRRDAADEQWRMECKYTPTSKWVPIEFADTPQELVSLMHGYNEVLMQSSG